MPKTEYATQQDLQSVLQTLKSVADYAIAIGTIARQLAKDQPQTLKAIGELVNCHAQTVKILGDHTAALGATTNTIGELVKSADVHCQMLKAKIEGDDNFRKL
jgi:hypothetical protein